jgi:tetratricopeptide (TPR) repeat protein
MPERTNGRQSKKEMTQYQPEDGAKLKRRWVEQAVSLAMQNRWADAVEVNRRILEQFPNDVDAHNRLGRALTELGNYSEARDAYTRAVELDPHNTIARKNIARLSILPEEKAPVKAQEQVDPRLFIAETGKTGVTLLVRPAPRETLAKMTVGDKVYLKPEGRALIILNASGNYLGQVEPRLSQRLIDLMRGGNRYAAAMMSMEDTNVRVIIREVYQDPSQSGKISFPTKGEGVGIRPYTKESLVRYDEEEEEEEELEEEFELEAEAETEERAEEPEFEEEENLET